MDTKSHDNYSQGSIVNKCYVVSIYDGLEDEKLQKICENTTEKVHGREVLGVIFSFINVNIIDSYTIKLFLDTTKVLSLLGSKVVWTGLKPGVISSIMDLNIHLEDIRICRDIDEAVKTITKK